MQAYSSARSEFKGIADVWLDANENPNASNLNRYPDPLQLRLKAAVSKIKNVPLGHIFVGNGSDEAIDLLFRALQRQGLFCVNTNSFVVSSATDHLICILFL